MEEAIHILLVEDDEVDVMNVKRAFKQCNIVNPLHVAGNGMEALQLLKGNGTPAMDPLPGIILLDINMPKMNGLEFLEALRDDETLRHISVFIMTTSNEQSDKMRAHELNVAGYIIKPVDYTKFIEAVQTLDAFWSLTELPE